MPAKIVLATHNQGKLREFREMLRGAIEGLDVDTEVIDAGAAGAPDVVEYGVTFAQNSLLKSRAVAAATGLIAIADDSGLSVDVLGGAPGIFSARWAGKHGDDEANLNLLLAQLSDIADDHRRARFVCAASMVTPEGIEAVEEGELAGTLLREPRGEGGFGYDPILAADGFTGEYAGLSCAQVPADVKNAISHRSQALTKLLPHLQAALAQ
ncbi:non-canonical purine NTP pyrophosphatase [Rothia nasimurium]|uniref:non-canonical purine NTP pyrophosphatase n=1 Tax=Rothia nasimurium TaxID=85336 RepID=UPI002DD666CA|nr:non-canonical purine NTP pyrophosphatase [Rothia nasimurium]